MSEDSHRDRSGRALVVASVLMLTFAGVTSAQDPTNSKNNCALKPDRVHVDIDGNTGQVNGGTQFPAGSNVQIVVTHKNPFKYQYRVEMTSASLEEAIATGFLAKYIPGFTALGVNPPASAAAAGPPAERSSCSATDKTNWEAVTEAAATAGALRTEVASALDPKVPTYKSYEDFVKATDVDALPSACSALCDTAADLSKSLSTLIDLGQLPDDAKTFADAGKVLGDAIAAFKAANNDACQKEHEKDLADAVALAAKAPQVQVQVNQLVDAKPSFQTLQKLLTNVLAEQYPFNEPFYPQTVGDATGVTVNIFRTNLRQTDPKEKKVTTVFIRIGQSTVSVSVGLAFTTTVDRRIGRVPANVPGTDGKDTLGNRFDYLENGGGRAIAVAMLNGRLPLAGDGWIGGLPSVLSTGVGLRLDGAGPTQADWIPVAVGWRLGSDHVLLTVGLHLTRADCLPDPKDADQRCTDRQGFKIGDVVPAGLGDPLPVQRIWNRGVLLGVTFKTQ